MRAYPSMARYLMRNVFGLFAFVGVMTVFTLVTLWAADWIQNYDETGRWE